MRGPLITITASTPDGLQTLIEIDGPHPGDGGKYGQIWKRYAYRVVEPGRAEQSGEVHALPEEGIVRLLERISTHNRR